MGLPATIAPVVIVIAIEHVARHRRALLIGGPILALLIGLAFYLLTGRYVSTDDAYIQAARVDIGQNRQ